MNKILAFTALIACSMIVFLYFSEEAINLPHAVNNQETGQQKKESLEVPVPKVNISKILQQKRVNSGEKIKSKLETVEKNRVKSYPIEDAEIYYVPPEQRYPGNLGGPPPLDFPDANF